ncbi:hypothetical protein KJ870_11155 [bacterium]|nr:hypothetical protein [bacterium]MBU1435488.1 hypothetical protein [bacterium]MBU1502588.1 hypothetical protein [bacterium]
MKKILFLYLTLVSLAFGYNYDDVVLKAQASIFPKIILLDKKIDNKLIDGKIVYTIVYDKTDYLTALSIEKFIDKKFQGYLDTYSYKINLVDLENFSEKTEASAIYVLNLKEHVERIATLARKKGIISFSYDLNNLKKGLMFSLVIEKSTVLYLKKENLFTKKIDFVDALLQMVRFVDQDYAYNESTQYDNGLYSEELYALLASNAQ